LIGGVSFAALLLAAPRAAVASPADAGVPWDEDALVASAPPPARPVVSKANRKRGKPAVRKAARKLDNIPVVPPGPLHIIVSIDRQRVTLFAGGEPFASSTISSGTLSHPTPLGVFSVIQKRRRHVSNLYGAPMPYMQRLTWSGTAMHQGPLPGYPASHGCIRLPKEFAQLLWKATRIGARVIVTRDEVAPVAVEHDRLFSPQPKMATAQRIVVPPAVQVLVKTADASNVLPGAVVPDAGRPLLSGTAVSAQSAEQSTKLSGGARAVAPAQAPAEPMHFGAHPDVADPAPPAAEPKRRTGRLSLFISRRNGTLYVRQGMEPLFEAPVTIERPDRPIGTHVYTAMGAGNGGMRWTVVSIPSGNGRALEPERAADGTKPRLDQAIQPPAADPLPSASAALDRIILPPEAAERISALITPGSSLIVSDNKLSGETRQSTDFIVLTP
jgi:lipoprotein-anchoring transpeptidase ErfK/SrfK